MIDRSDAYFREMTESPVDRLIIRLAIPSAISMLITNLYNLVDTVFVGRLGTSASGAVGVVFGFMAFVQVVGFLFGQGSGSIVARKLGQKSCLDASRIASTGFFSSLILGFCICVAGIVWKDPIIRMLGSTYSMHGYARAYMGWILVAVPFMTASYTMNTLLRYEGKALFAMKGMMAGAILNIWGELYFVFYLDMGIAGAGLATAISQLVGFCILLSPFLRGKTHYTLKLKLVSFDLKEHVDIVTTGLPSMTRLFPSYY